MTDLNKFLSEVAQRNVQRTARFRCRINLGAGALATQFPQAAKWLQEGLVCQTTNIPDRAFEAETLTVYGYEQEYPIYNVFSALTCEFLLPFNTDGQNEVLHLFHTWIDYIFPVPNGTIGAPVLRFPDQYRLRGSEGFVIETYDSGNTVSARYTFEGIYPSQVSEIRMSWNDVDGMMTLPVAFKFMYWSRV